MPDTAVTWEDAAPAQSDVQWETPAAPAEPKKASTYSSEQGRGEQISQVAADALHSAKIAGGQVWNNLKGLPEAFNPTPRTTAEKVGATLMVPAPVTRMVSGVLDALGRAPQIPAAIRDINAAPNAGQAYSDVAARGAGDALTGALLEAAATEGPGLVQSAAGFDPKAALSATADTAKEAVKAQFPHATEAIEQVGKIKERYQTAKAENAKAVASTPEEVKPVMDEILSRGVEKPKVPEGDAAGLKSLRVKNGKVIDTDPLGLDKKLSDSFKPGDSDTAYFQQAKAKLGPDAKISEVAKQAQGLKDQAAEFEKTFNQPLSNYTENGKFNMKDFLDEVVKPGTEPPSQVISKVFGGDGVELVRKITGEDIHKWAQAEPRAARVAREVARKPEPPPDTSVPGKRNGGSPDESFDPKQGDRMVKGADPKRYLNLSGADAGSVMKTQADIDTVNFWRERIRKGEPVPKSELRVNGEKSVLEADGRHRALAADLEGKKIDFIVRKRPLTGVRK